MANPASTKPRITDSEFRHAVDLIDAGDVAELLAWVGARPHLLSDSADDDGSFAGAYFAQPKLLWFVAENPIRNGELPANIAQVTQTLIELARKHRVDDLGNQLDYTLSLVTSGLVARECGVQQSLVQALVSAGADPNSAIRPALAHREIDACEALLACGAEVTLPLAAGLGREEDVNRLKKDASAELMQEALAISAINGQARSTRILVDNGADPNRFNPPGAHEHTTPLHQAINAGSLETVCTLVTRGADVTIKDKLYSSDARGWATHMGHDDILAFLYDAEVMLPAIRAVRAGEVEQLREWLEEHPERVNDVLGDNPRTLLHYATDWPGFAPRVGETIQCLAAFGANVNARYVGPGTTATETPLHWAASTDDVDAASALLTAGADLDGTGGCIGNGTPLVLAVIFQHWRVAEQLVEAGATIALALVAGMGRMDLVETFFDEVGEFRNPYPSMPHCDTVSDGAREINAALCLASLGGRMEVAHYLVDRGANVNTHSPVNTTPLDEAINNDHEELAAFLRSLGAKRFAELETE